MDKELVKQSAKRLSKQHRMKRWWTGVIVMALLVLAGTIRLLTYSAAATNQTGDGIQLQDEWINKITLSYTNNPGDWEVWEDVTSDMNVSGTDHLRFNISYLIPEYTFDKKNTNTVIYQIPIVNKVEKIKEQTGDIINPSTGAVIGTYAISADGEMKLIFDDSFLSTNQESAINGTVAVEFAAGDIKKNAEGKLELPFSDKLDIHFPTIVIKDNHSIDTQKQAQIVDNKEGVILYSIRISSVNGTAGDIAITDEMGRKDKNGNILEKISAGITEVTVIKNGNAQMEQDSSALPTTLPQLLAGEFYTITYKAQISRDLLDSYNVLTVNNKVKASFTDPDGKEFSADAACDVRFEKVSFTKWSNVENGRIKWSIRINENKADISGWTLWDSMAKEITSAITISPDPNRGGTSAIIQFDDQGRYIFPAGSCESYTIVYYTDTPLGDNIHVTNKASLTPPGGDSTEIKSDCYVNNNPITKEGTMNTTLDESDINHKLTTIDWKVTIHPNHDIPAGWIYKDYLANEQWFTWEQVQEAAASLRKIAQTENFYAVDEKGNKVDCNHLQKDSKYIGFEATFLNALPKGDTYIFLYQSTADVGTGESNNEYKNTAIVNNVSKEKTVTYESSQAAVIKYDTTKGNKDSQDSIHNYYELDHNRLSWRIETNLPKNAAEHDIVFTEYLPKGLILENLDFSLSGTSIKASFDVEELENTGNSQEIRLDNHNYRISAQKTGNGIYDITIPKELAELSIRNNRVTLIDVVTRISDTYQWTQDSEKPYFYSGEFNNKVTVKEKADLEETLIGEDTQKQTIQKDENANMINKSLTSEKKGNSYINNVLSYSLKINPDGTDLVKNSSTVTFVDELTYSNLNVQKPISVILMPGSLKVHYMNPDGTEGELLSQNDTPYTYEAMQDASKKNVCKITMTIPDGTPLIVTYSYYINCEKDAWINGPISNTAKLYGTGTDYSQEIKVGEFSYQESSATASKLGVTFVKVDSNNNAITLPGAEFELSQYDRNSHSYEKVRTYTTKEDGLISITNSKDYTITYNKAYHLVETKAPRGYQVDSTPIYFYIESTNTQEYPFELPTDFEGEKYINGQQKYISNEKRTTAIQVNKEWIDFDNRFTEAAKDSIAFDLHQIDSTLPPAGERCDVTLKYKNIEGEDETRVVQVLKGSKIGLEIETTDDWFNYYADNVKCVKMSISGAAKLTSNEMREIAEAGEVKWHRKYTVWIQVNGDTELSNFPNLYPADPIVMGNISSDAQQMATVDTAIGTYTISKNNNWRWDSTTAGEGGTDLELPLKQKQADGKMHYYSYYVTEHDGAQYQVKYSTDVSGITYGTITITNTVAKGYELPATGGTGTKGYMIGGWTLVIVALSAMIYRYKKNKFMNLRREGRE